jgi:hypothetical protein
VTNYIVYLRVGYKNFASVVATIYLSLMHYLFLHENRCDTLRLGVRELKRGLSKIKRDVMEPYTAASQRAVQLNNVHKAQYALKQLVKLTTAVKKLQALEAEGVLNSNTKHLSGVTDTTVSTANTSTSSSSVLLRELSKAGELLRDAESVMTLSDVAGITLIEKYRHYVHTIGTR